MTLLPVDGWVNPVKWMPKIPNPSKSHDLDGFPICLLLRVGSGKWEVGTGKEGIGEFHFLPGRSNVEATNMRRSPKPKVLMYRSGSASSSAARDRVSFGIIISSSLSFFQPPIGLQLHKQKKKKEVSQRVSSFEWVMIRRNLNLSLIRRFGTADNKGIPELLLLRDLKQQQQQQQQQHLGCVGEEPLPGMGDEEEVKLIKKQEDDGSIEEKKKKIEQGEDLGNSPLKSSSSSSSSSASVPPPEPPEKPLPGDCCGNGCIPCVWDTYNDELEDYNKLLKAYNSQSKP